MSAQVAADLRAAAEVLERDGWTQMALVDGSCRCVSGAFAYVASDGSSSYPGKLADASPAFLRWVQLMDQLRKQVGEGVVDWNDTLGRTAAEVIAALRAAADRAEQESDR